MLHGDIFSVFADIHISCDETISNLFSLIIVKKYIIFVEDVRLQLFKFRWPALVKRSTCWYLEMKVTGTNLSTHV